MCACIFTRQNSKIVTVLLILLQICTVELRSKGPSQKGNPLLRENILSPNNYFLIYFYIGYKGISVYGKNCSGPMKSLRAKFNCTYKTCAHMYITSKRIELESPGCSGIEENLKSFNT